MANGRDDQPPGQGRGGGHQPTDTGPNLDVASSGGMSGLGDNWGTGGAAFDEVVDNVKAVLEGMKGEILKAWLAPLAVIFVLESAEIVAYSFATMTGILEAFIAILLWPVSILIGLGYLAATAAQLTLYGAVRDRVFHGIEPEGWLQALRSGSGDFVSIGIVLVALSVAIPCGSAICLVPGLAIAFFSLMTPYILATEEIGIGDAFKKSYERSKQYWQVVVVTVGALLVASIFPGCFIGVGSAASGVLPEPLGYVISQYGHLLGAGIFQFALFVVWGGVFITVDAAETGQMPGR